jgi:hypothetical protein
LRLTAGTSGRQSGNRVLRSIVAVDGDILLGEHAGEQAVAPAPRPSSTSRLLSGFYITAEISFSRALLGKALARPA